MEWSIGRFDAFIPAFPGEGTDIHFPRVSTPDARFIVPIGVTVEHYQLRGLMYPRDGSIPLSANAAYLVITEEQRKLIEDVTEAQVFVIVISNFLPSLQVPAGLATPAAQERWLLEIFPYLKEELRANPEYFPTAQAAWRHQAMRRMGRDWKSYCPQQNGFWFTHEHGAFSEAFMLVENRPNRSVITCDLRSAYGWAIATQDYPSPARWTTHETPPTDNRPHLLLCRLSKPTEWLSRHHPWRYTEQGLSMPFFWGQDDSIAGWFADFEIESIKGLCAVEIISVAVPQSWGPHPLANQVATWYTKRLSNKSFSSCWKAKIAAAHTWSVRYKTETANTADLHDHMIERFVSRPFSHGKRMAYNVHYPDIGPVTHLHQGPDAGIWLPSVWTALLVRTRVFNLLRWAHENVPEAKCAYINVDSIHWTMPKNIEATFCTALERTSWAGNDLGKVRIEHISDRGLWLRAGAYILWNSSSQLVHTTLGNNPWQAHKQKGFWDRNLQMAFPLTGGIRQCWYLRPHNMTVWTAQKSYLTENIVRTLRWKQAVWIKACTDFARGKKPQA